MDGSSVSASLPVGVVSDTNWKVVGSGDYNGDLKSDILWRHSSSGTVWLYEMDSNIVTASTGIGAGSAAGEAMVCALLAVKPKNDNVKVFAVPSPLQCPALDYRSSFARAVEIDQPGSRLLTISGTASIEPGGETVHIGDTEKQIELTMEVIHAILKSRDMDWKDTSRAIAYFKDIDEAYLLEKYCIENHLPELPVAISHADVCRHDLLFEIELDAVKAN